MSLTTKSIAAVTISVAVIFLGAFAFATPAKADLLSDLQAQVQALLAQIAALQAAQGGGGGACVTFTQNHQMGDTGGQVMEIQKFLNRSGAQVAVSGAGSPGNETSYFGARTRAAVSKFQAANGISPTAGYWGPITRAKANSMCTGMPGVPGVPGVPVTGNGLKVMLAAGSPNNVALVQGQAIGELARFEFQNPTGSEITVTSLGFNRIGVSNDETLSNVYLYEGATRLTDSAAISNTAFSFNESAGLFKVPAGGKKTISVRSDIAGSSNGQQVGVALMTVGASGTLDSSVVFPINGGIQTISAATLATVDFNTSTSPTATSLDPQNDYTVWQNTASIGTRAVNLETFTLENMGSADPEDIKNLRLYVDGTQVGSAVMQLDSNDRVTFDLSASPKRLESGGRVIKVVADIVGGSSETFQMSLRRASDGRFVDTELKQPVLATAAGSTFSARSATSATINSGTVSVVKANTSPTSNVAVNATNVKWATFEMRAAGENVKIDNLSVYADTSVHNGGLDNGKVFLNGVQVGSTKDLSNESSGTGVNFTFGSSFILRQGQAEIVDIIADAKTSTSTALDSGETVSVGLVIGSSNGEGRDSKSVTNVPSSVVTGNTITVSSSSLTATKYSGYGNQTMIAGANNARIGSFTLSAGSTEGVNVNTIIIALSSNNAATITDLRLVDNSNGAAIGTTKASPSTSNSFAVNVPIGVSGTKTIDVYANIKSGSQAGPVIATLTGGVSGTGGTGATTGNSTTIAADLTLQTITVGSGTLTVTRDPGTPVNTNVIAGSMSVQVGKFDFAAQNSSYTVQELKVKVPADAATSVSNVTLKYKNSAGVEQTVSQALSLSSNAQTHATATFTGLTFYVPLNDSADVDVYVDVPTVTSGAKSGAAISVLLDANEGFKAVDSSGSQTTSYTTEVASNDSSGYGTKYVKKTVPTLARLSTGYTSNTVATGIGLYRFTMTADAAGAVDWREVSFAITTSGSTMNISTWQLYDVTGSATQIGANVNSATAANPFNVPFCPGTSCTIGEAEQVGAGSSKTYEVRATVAGWATAGNSVAISFGEDSAAIVNAAASGLHAGQNFVWSDRSANGHSTTTADWTNGYLVKDVDNDVRSCQFGTVTTCTP